MTFLLLVGATTYSIREMALQQDFIGNQSDRVITLVGEITSDPHVTRSKIVGSRIVNGKSSFLIRSSSVSIQGNVHKVRLPFRIIAKDCKVGIGTQVRVTGKVITSRERRVAATIIVNGQVEVLRKSDSLNTALNRIRDDFMLSLSKRRGDAASLIPGIVIGDTRLQTQEFAELMRRSGLSHLTAVSGANFAIVSSFIFWLTGWFIPNRRQRLIVSGIFLFFFLLLVRPSPSVLRAAVMAAVVLISRYRGTQSRAASSLAVAIGLLLIADPFQGFDPGFVLSVLATSSLIFIAPSLERWLSQYLAPSMAEVLSISAAAGVACAPYIIFLSGEISVVSILLNTLVAPVVGLLTVIAFVAVLFTTPFPHLSDIFIQIAMPMAQWIVTVAHLQQKAPVISMHWITSTFLLTIFLFTIYKRSIVYLGACIVVALFAWMQIQSFPGREWDLGQCDVGQGDALLLNLGNGAAALFDAGPDPHLLKNCLREFKIKSLPLVVISHFHADHYFGVTNGLAIPIGEIWVNNEAKDIKIPPASLRIVHAGDRFQIGAVDVEVIWPSDVEREFSIVAGDGSRENNRSIVTRVFKDGVGILVTGDVEPDAQDEILKSNKVDGVEIIKVPHHGSRFQSKEFLSGTGARFALISVGKGNSYGHPSDVTLQELVSSGARVFRTDRDGAISLEWHQDEGHRKYVFSARTSGRKWWRIQWR